MNISKENQIFTPPPFLEGYKVIIEFIVLYSTLHFPGRSYTNQNKSALSVLCKGSCFPALNLRQSVSFAIKETWSTLVYVTQFYYCTSDVKSVRTMLVAAFCRTLMWHCFQT